MVVESGVNVILQDTEDEVLLRTLELAQEHREALQGSDLLLVRVWNQTREEAGRPAVVLDQGTQATLLADPEHGEVERLAAERARNLAADPVEALRFLATHEGADEAAQVLSWTGKVPVVFPKVPRSGVCVFEERTGRRRWHVRGDLRRPGSGYEDDANNDAGDWVGRTYPDVEADPESGELFAYCPTRERAVEVARRLNAGDFRP